MQRMTQGMFVSMNVGSVSALLIMGISITGYSLPSFFIGLVLIFFVILQLKWLPFPSYVSPFENFGSFLQTMLLPANSPWRGYIRPSSTA